MLLCTLEPTSQNGVKAYPLSASKQFFVPDFVVNLPAIDRNNTDNIVLSTCSLEEKSFTDLNIEFEVNDSNADERRVYAYPSVSVYIDSHREYRKDSEIGYETELLRGVLKGSKSVAIETDCYSKSGCLNLYFSVSLE